MWREKEQRTRVARKRKVPWGREWTREAALSGNGNSEKKSRDREGKRGKGGKKQSEMKCGMSRVDVRGRPVARELFIERDGQGQGNAASWTPQPEAGRGRCLEKRNVSVRNPGGLKGGNIGRKASGAEWK